MPYTAAIGKCSCKREKHEIASWHKGRRQAVCRSLNGDIARERRLRNRSERIDCDDVILAKSLPPLRTQGRHTVAHAQACLKFDAVALTVVEANGFDMGEPLQRPGQAYSGILPPGKEHKRTVWVQSHFGVPE